MRFYGKGKGKRPASKLGAKMLDGAKRKRGTLRPKREVPWLGAVMLYSAAVSAVFAVLGAVIGRHAGSMPVGVVVGSPLGALAGAFYAQGSPAEAILAAMFAAALACLDYLVGWGGVPFAAHPETTLSQVSMFGPAGALAGVYLGRTFWRKRPRMEETQGKEG